ncbi:oligopeptide/dipeptide ABC transporter ATP-binding protein [Streptomyces lusitanus]|uniref:oligopeptide/dipeptide ABC transporter ATP-binding protein n=1 Tax=Streptomyces lusitanus TaxID=68232 RepID=UPI00363852D9
MAAIPGQPPDLRTPVTGCAFAARCPLATEVCDEHAPAPLQVSEGRSTSPPATTATVWSAKECRRCLSPCCRPWTCGAASEPSTPWTGCPSPSPREARSVSSALRLGEDHHRPHRRRSGTRGRR